MAVSHQIFGTELDVYRAIQLRFTDVVTAALQTAHEHGARGTELAPSAIRSCVGDLLTAMDIGSTDIIDTLNDRFPPPEDQA